MFYETQFLEKGDPNGPSPLPIWLLLSCVVNRRLKVVADSQRPAQAAPYRECSTFDKEIGQGCDKDELTNSPMCQK